MFASDYASHQVFKEWMDKTTFYPLPHMNLHVHLVECDSIPTVPGSRCQDCEQKWSLAKIPEAVGQVSWKWVQAGGDLTVLVSYTSIGV